MLLKKPASEKLPFSRTLKRLKKASKKILLRNGRERKIGLLFEENVDG